MFFVCLFVFVFVFNSIPIQLAVENNKFKFDTVKKGGRFRDYESSITWLEQAGIISICYNVNNMQYPLEGYKIFNSFKLYMNDTGLLMALFDKEMSTAIYTNELGIYKGNIYENIIADTFVKNQLPLYYYQDGFEIDFLQSFNLTVLPIEVKASDGRSKSLKAAMNKYKDVSFGIRVKNKNVGFDDNILTIPHYLAFLLTKDNLNELVKRNNIIVK